MEVADRQRKIADDKASALRTKNAAEEAEEKNPTDQQLPHYDSFLEMMTKTTQVGRRRVYSSICSKCGFGRVR